MIQKSNFQIAFIISIVFLITFFHLSTSRESLHLHGIYQHLYYIPIILAGFWFRLRGGILTSLGVTACYAFYSSSHATPESGLYAEIIIYHIVGIVTGLLSRMEKQQGEKAEKTAEDLRKAYQELQSTFEQLKQADKLAALGELSAGLAHEIRNPLGSIKGAMEILDSEFDDKNPKKEFVNIIKDEIERLNKLVSEFTLFGKPQDPELREADINEIVGSVIRLTANKAKQQKVSIATELCDSLPYVLVDSEQIKQVLLNTVINGIQSMPGGGTLVLRTAESDCSIQISIMDEGVGIEKEKLSRVFDPFFTTKENGSGLGLSISYQIIKKHGGDIIVSPNSGRGLAFTVTIPIRDNNE